MSLLATVAPHLPFVRRYARALTGSQTAGDNLVRDALQALANGEQRLDPSLSTRVALYRAFQLSAPIGEPRGERREALAQDAPARLLKIAPASRQAFLLTAMEGFTTGETATIMD